MVVVELRDLQNTPWNAFFTFLQVFYELRTDLLTSAGLPGPARELAAMADDGTGTNVLPIKANRVQTPRGRDHAARAAPQLPRPSATPGREAGTQDTSSSGEDIMRTR